MYERPMGCSDDVRPVLICGRSVGAVATAARAASARRAAWLPPVDLRLTDAAALRCQISAAVDPAGAALSLIVTATIVAVADDGSGPPCAVLGAVLGLPGGQCSVAHTAGSDAVSCERSGGWTPRAVGD